MIVKFIFFLLILLFIKIFILKFDYRDYFVISVTLLIIFLGYLYIFTDHISLIIFIFIASISLIIYSFCSSQNEDSRLIITDGVINFKNMYKNNYSIYSLVKDLKEIGISNLNNNNCGILKNGKLYIYYKKKVLVKYPIPIIFDGNIDKNGLDLIKKNRQWLLNILDKKEVDYDCILYAFYFKKNLYIIKK